MHGLIQGIALGRNKLHSLLGIETDRNSEKKPLIGSRVAINSTPY